MTRANQILINAFHSAEINRLVGCHRTLKQQMPDREFVGVICDLTCEAGSTFAATFNADEYAAHRKPEHDLWTFLLPLNMWQEHRKTTGHIDDFRAAPGAMKYVVVTDSEILVGAVNPSKK